MQTVRPSLAMHQARNLVWDVYSKEFLASKQKLAVKMLASTSMDASKQVLSSLALEPQAMSID